MPTTASIRATLLQLVWILWSVGWCASPQIVVTRGSQAGENLVNAQIVESTMTGSRAHVVLMIGCDALDLPQECANLQQLDDVQRTACVAPMRFSEPMTTTGGVTWAAVDGFVSDVGKSFATVQADEPHQLTLTLDGGAIQPGEPHSAVLTIRHAFRRYTAAQWWQWSSNWQDATITLNFSVQPPDYYVLAIPQDTTVELRAGEVAARTFTLYNVRSTAVNWRISSDFQCPGAVIGSGGPTSADGHAWLTIAPAIPVDRSCSNVMLPQAPEPLHFNITAPTRVPSNDLAYSLVIECQDTFGTEYVWVESQRTVQLNIDFTVTVRPGYPDPARSNFEVVEPQGTISAGGVLQIEVNARDEFGNSDTDAGLHFTMQTRSVDLAGVMREQVGETGSYFENGRYLIDSDTLLPGVYTISVSFTALDGAQTLQIQRDSTGSAHLEQEVAPIVCNNGQVPHPDTGTICMFCEPGKHPARNGNTCENCPAGKYSTLGTCATCSYGMVVSADQTSCESCPPFSSPLNSTTGTCVCDVGYVHNETKVGLNVSTEEYEDSIRRDVNGMHFKGTDCQGKTPCCDVCPTGAVCRRGSRPGHLTIYPDVGMWIDITGEYLGKPLTVVPCPPRSCPGYCKLRDSKGLLADPIETGCKGERGVDWPKYSLAEFDEWIDDHVRRTDPNFPNACKNGASGIFCATCDSHNDGKLYKKVDGTCVSCTHFPVWAAVLSLLMYTLLCLFFVHKSRRIETGVDCDAHISSSIVGILVFFMQTAMLLPREGLAIFKLKWVAEAFKPLVTVLRLWPDLTDDDSDSCFSTGIFIADYTAKFLVPFVVLGITWFLSRYVLRLKARQVHMGLLFSVQFGLFPVIMNSVSTFFCRDDVREFAGVPKPPAPVVFAPCAKAPCAPSHFSMWWDDTIAPRRSRIPEICTTTLPVRDMPTGQEPTPEQYRAIEQGCHLDFSSNRLRLDPGRECAGADYYIASFAGVLIAIFCTVFIPVLLYQILAKKMQQHERLLRISMYMKYGIDKGMTMIVNDPLWKSGHSAEFAAQDPFSFLYYPLRRECFWWSIVWIFRPAAIAIVYSARDRHTLVAFDMADWRMLAVMILMIYNTVQATVRPFKHLNESQLDATSVLLLMLLFSVSINVDMMRYNIDSNDHDALLGLVSWFGVLMLSTVIVAALLSKRLTNKHIKRKIAQQHWKMAWTNMSAESDPLSQMLDDDTTLAQHWTKRLKHVNTALKMGVRTRLPVFEQIDVDGSNVIDLDEFLQWWHLRTLRHGGKNNGGEMDDSHSVQDLAERLFHQYDTDRSGGVSRDEFEPILKELHAQYQDNQQMLRARQSLPVRQSELQHEKQRVLDRIDSFPRFTVSKALSIPDEHGHQFEYYRVDETNLPSATSSAETRSSTNPVHQLSNSFEVEGGAAASILEPRCPSEQSAEGLTSTSPDESLKAAPASSGSESVSTSLTVVEIFDEIDADGSGEISIEELTSWWRQHTNNSDYTRLLPKLEEAFSIIEYRDGVPGVSLSEFEEVILVVALDDWEVTTDPGTSKQYYVNRITRESSWTEPDKGCIDAFLRAAGVSRNQENVRSELQQRRRRRPADKAPVTSRSRNIETSIASDISHGPHSSRSGAPAQLISPWPHDLGAASPIASRSESEVRRVQVLEEAKAKRRSTRLAAGLPTVPTNVSFVSASVTTESSMIKEIVAAVCAGSATFSNSNDVYIDDLMAFLQTAQRTSLAKTDMLALKRHFNEAFPNRSAAGQEAPAALSVQELRHCLASLVSQDYTKGIDPKSGRAYYVHKQTRAPVWVIDAAAVDACLGRFFGKVR